MNNFKNVKKITELESENKIICLTKKKIKLEYKKIKVFNNKKNINILKRKFINAGLQYTRNLKKINNMKKMVLMLRQNHIYQQIDKILELYLNTEIKIVYKLKILRGLLQDVIRYHKDKQKNISSLIFLFQL